MSVWRRLTTVLAISGLALGIASVPSHASTTAPLNSNPISIWVENNDNGYCCFIGDGNYYPQWHAHAAGGVIDVESATGSQSWQLENSATWPGNGTVWEIHLIGGGCFNWYSGDDHFYDNSCQNGDVNEQFLFLQDGAPNGWWVISRAATIAPGSGGYQYVTAQSTSQSSAVYALPAGNGGRAAWGQACQINC